MLEARSEIDNCPESVCVIRKKQTPTGTGTPHQIYCPITGLATIMIARNEDGILNIRCETRDTGNCKSKLPDVEDD